LASRRFPASTGRLRLQGNGRGGPQRRGERGKVDWQKVRQRDEQRRLRVLEILRSATLTAAEDYYHAAMVLQHGGQPADYLLAHILTVAAVGKGYQEALWLSAATLDRYLDSVGKSQVFGTQYHQRGPSQPWTQEPYQRDLLTDALRKQFGVPALSGQAGKVERMNRLGEP
jgi:hypothetical protein